MYKLDFNSELAFLGINSLYFDRQYDEGDDFAREQFHWVADQLYREQHRKIIPLYHIWPGIEYVHYESIHWKQNYTDLMLNVFQDNKEKISFIVGAHTHYLGYNIYNKEPLTLSVREMVEQSVEKAFDNVFVSPSISPIFNNNPGITVFELNRNKKAVNIRTHYLYLASTFNNAPQEEWVWRVFDFSKVIGAKEFSAKALQRAEEKMEAEDIDKLLDYLVDKIGYDSKDPAQRKLVVETYYAKQQGTVIMHQKKKKNEYSAAVFLCMQKTSNIEQFNLCVRDKGEEPGISPVYDK